ncbi:MAG TPA: hypothetical protein VHE34_22500 [Puia sp.]|uniref:hypothetical protein n=1 Tax=Puia sp. TaxID=2045100 RepID=UPI002C71B868|nr:hypothetical protein [Puia sp.]HVU98019.1 hypothetical protein [Puia sp.]
MNKRIVLSEEIHELTGNRPPWVIRNGSLSFLLLLLAVAAASWCVRVPAVVHGSLSVSIRDDQPYGQMRIAGGCPLLPGQQVMIHTAGTGVLMGSVELVSRIPSSSTSSSEDSCLIHLRLKRGSTLRGAKDRLSDAELTVHQRLFDRWWGVARLWYR